MLYVDNSLHCLPLPITLACLPLAEAKMQPAMNYSAWSAANKGERSETGDKGKTSHLPITAIFSSPLLSLLPLHSSP